MHRDLPEAVPDCRVWAAAAPSLCGGGWVYAVSEPGLYYVRPDGACSAVFPGVRRADGAGLFHAGAAGAESLCNQLGELSAVGGQRGRNFRCRARHSGLFCPVSSQGKEPEKPVFPGSCLRSFRVFKLSGVHAAPVRLLLWSGELGRNPHESSGSVGNRADFLGADCSLLVRQLLFMAGGHCRVRCVRSYPVCAAGGAAPGRLPVGGGVYEKSLYRGLAGAGICAAGSVPACGETPPGAVFLLLRPGALRRPDCCLVGAADLGHVLYHAGCGSRPVSASALRKSGVCGRLRGRFGHENRGYCRGNPSFPGLFPCRRSDPDPPGSGSRRGGGEFPLPDSDGGCDSAEYRRESEHSGPHPDGLCGFRTVFHGRKGDCADFSAGLCRHRQ